MEEQRALSAAKDGDLATLEQLLEAGALGPGVIDALGAGLVHHATRAGHLACVKFLVQRAKLPGNQRAHNGATPVHDAAATGSLAELRWLVREGGCGLQVSPDCSAEGGVREDAGAAAHELARPPPGRPLRASPPRKPHRQSVQRTLTLPCPKQRKALEGQGHLLNRRFQQELPAVLGGSCHCSHVTRALGPGPRQGPRWARGLGDWAPAGGRGTRALAVGKGFWGSLGVSPGPALSVPDWQCPLLRAKGHGEQARTELGGPQGDPLGPGEGSLTRDRWRWRSLSTASSSALPAAPRGARWRGAGSVPGNRPRLSARSGDAPRAPGAGVAAQ